jgi:hypothetical protein
MALEDLSRINLLRWSTNHSIMVGSVALDPGYLASASRLLK